MSERPVTLGDVRNTLRSQDRRYDEYRRRVEAVVPDGATAVIPDELLKYGLEKDKQVEQDYARLQAHHA
jgi:hypothetical protein